MPGFFCPQPASRTEDILIYYLHKKIIHAAQVQTSITKDLR